MDEVPLDTGCLSLLEPFEPVAPVLTGFFSSDLVSVLAFLSADLESEPSPFAEPLRLSVR